MKYFAKLMFVFLIVGQRHVKMLRILVADQNNPNMLYSPGLLLVRCLSTKVLVMVLLTVVQILEVVLMLVMALMEVMVPMVVMVLMEETVLMVVMVQMEEMVPMEV